MDIPRGPLPLSEADFLDFIYNYFKAEYAPIRWIFASTAEAVPRQPKRWLAMGDELCPTSFRPADPRAHADLEALNYCIRKWDLDAAFVRGLVVRYAKYRVHERLEKKLYECCRGDLMVRKALKEKNMIDKLWPSPAPANLPKELLQQGVQVRQWFGYMFFKYFRALRAEDEFSFRPEVAQALKSAGTLILVPFSEHISSGPAEPIRPIVLSGAGFVNAPAARNRAVKGFGEPDRFEIRFDSPGEVQNTVARSVVRQCRCLKCGTSRDVQVSVLIDPTPGGTVPQSDQRRPSNPNTSAPRRSHTSKVSQRYTPGYDMPGAHDSASRQALPPQVEPHNATSNARSQSPVQKKQCQACTFLNHPDLTVCEMCQSALPESVITKPPSPVQQRATKPAHAHSVSLPSNSQTEEAGKEERPGLLNKVNRYSLGLGSTLYSISPFSQPQLHQSSQQAAKPSASEPRVNGPLPGEPEPPTARQTRHAPPSSTANTNLPPEQPQPQLQPHRDPAPSNAPPSKPRTQGDSPTSSHPPRTPPETNSPPQTDPPQTNHPEMIFMPLTPPPTSATARRPTPLGLPANLMDDYVPVSPPLHNREVEEEDAGWGEVRREEVRDSDSEDEDEGGVGRGMVDLDEVAREEMGVWGEREEE